MSLPSATPPDDDPQDDQDSTDADHDDTSPGNDASQPPSPAFHSGPLRQPDAFWCEALRDMDGALQARSRQAEQIAQANEHANEHARRNSGEARITTPLGDTGTGTGTKAAALADETTPDDPDNQQLTQLLHIPGPLAIRHRQDFQRTGRRWPDPTHPERAPQLGALSMATGELDQWRFAFEQGVRYAASSRLPSANPMQPTNIFCVLYWGLGFSVEVLDPREAHPATLAIYQRRGRVVKLHPRILGSTPPTGDQSHDPGMWERTIDASISARCWVAWACGIHLTGAWDTPICAGFRLPTAYLAPESIERQEVAMVCALTLLSPPERLWRQLEAYGVPQEARNLPGFDWRAYLRASSLVRPANMDPVQYVLHDLAQRNRCRTIGVEVGLDGPLTPHTWNHWPQRVVQSSPTLLALREEARAYYVAEALADTETGPLTPIAPMNLLPGSVAGWPLPFNPVTPLVTSGLFRPAGSPPIMPELVV